MLGSTADPDIGDRLSSALEHPVSLWPLQPAEALDHYRLVLQMDPNHSGAYEKLALVQKELEKETVSVEYEEFPKGIDIILIP